MRQWLHENREFIWPVVSVLIGIMLQMARRIVRKRTPEELSELRQTNPKFAAFLLFAGAVGIDWERIIDGVQTIAAAIMASRTGQSLEPGAPPPPSSAQMATRGERELPP